MQNEQDGIYEDLNELLSSAGPLAKAPAELVSYFDDLLIVRLAHRYMEGVDGIENNVLAVICSAGPPGAGKSSAIRALNFQNYRWIDPDEIKDLILTEALDQGLLDYRDRHVLADKKPVGPRELASHVHHTSTRVADLVRHLSLDAGENHHY